MGKFAFENLEIYQRAVDFALEIRKICRDIRADYEILDQLKRAALLISLNLAEGSGRFQDILNQISYNS